MQALSVPIHRLAPLTSLTYRSIKMKRINPKTGLPFVHGFVREDGYVFVSYQQTKLRKDGTFKENWYTPEKFKNRNFYIVKHHAKNRLSNQGRAQQLLNGAKGRVKKSNGIVTIDRDWVQQKLDKGICELTGLKFNLELSDKTRMHPYSPSLDRINSEDSNYTKTNTRVVLTAVNLTLSNFGEQEILPILEAMVTSIKEKTK